MPNEPIKSPSAHHAIHTKAGSHSDFQQRKYADGADICIVGAGAAGGVMAHTLSKAGFSVVVIEAGPFWDPQNDFASDELSMQKLGWQDTRIVSGENPLTLGHNNSGRGVGGGTTHFTGVFLRLHEDDFCTKTVDGVGEDWPISYSDLERYYNQIERDIAVSGPKHFPWGAFQGPYPYPEREPISANAELFRLGCDKLGLQSVVAPLAINSAPFDGRPPCINRGFCNQGCMPNAKFSTLVHHIPKAMAQGAEILSDCMVTQVLVNDEGRVTGVTFVHEGRLYIQLARVVVLASFVVETPRLLLHSATAKWPDGLANNSGWVGKAIMPHSSHDLYGRYDEEVRLYKGTPVLALTQDFYASDDRRGFQRGYSLLAHGSRPLEMAKGLAKKGQVWGEKLREVMLDYNFYGRITLVGEVLPNPENCVTLAVETDEYGMPLANVQFSYGSNDHRLISHAVDRMKEIMEASGGKPEYVVEDTAHLMGGCRMGSNPDTSVVNSFGQSHDIPNLYIAGASVFVTSGGANPTNTVMALALRSAEHLMEQIRQRAI